VCLDIDSDRRAVHSDQVLEVDAQYLKMYSSEKVNTALGIQGSY
jgi:hypothetical protein